MFKDVFKKIALSLFVFLAIISFSFTSQAEKVDLSKYEIINPVEKISSTADRNLLINGKAPSKSKVNIDMYVTTDLTRKNFNLSKLPEDSDYIATNKIELTSGNMGFFQHEISLVLGMNKIVLDFGIKELNPREFIIYVYDNTVEATSIINLNKQKFIELVPNLK